MASPKLTAVTSYDDFLAQPLGRYFVDGRMLAWALSSSFCGFTFWAPTNEHDVDRLAQPVLVHPPTMADKISVLVNVRRVDSIDLTILDRLGKGLREHHDAYERRVHRVAVVRPTGFTSALAAGIGQLLIPFATWRLVDSEAAALAWLGMSDHAAQVAGLERLVNDALAQAPELLPLRNWLASEPKVVTIDAAAKELGQSRRSLQRLLATVGTSFSEETDRHRLQLAQKALRSADDKLEAIAHRLGFSSLSSFGAFYRRMTGESPSHLRRAARRNALPKKA